MTMKAIIVNASNWEGEDYLVSLPGREDVLLRPGDSTEIGTGHGAPSIIDVKIADATMDHATCKPFRLNGEQVYPEVFVKTGRTGQHKHPGWPPIKKKENK